ncbi:MAG: efflux RND transporter periplasmic adaptor subunit [candidate division Zixibacteria bacterium]|nr:efflux RND transporter periplasmic adaptor subunit [candidate division Zixibacteria bacterium]
MKKKTIIIIGVVVVIGVFAVISMMSNTSKATSVSVATVERQNLTEKVSASGRIQPQTKVDITSEVSGEIIALPVVEGQTVKAGELLLVLDTIQIKADVRRMRYTLDGTKAQLSGAEANFAQAEEEYQRQKSLFEKDGTAETALSAAHYAYLNAQASLDGARASMRGTEAAYEKELDRFRKAKIVAPMDGVITFLDVEAGEIAAAQTAFTQGRTLMTISNLSVFEVEVEVDETEINKVILGQKADIEVDAFPDTTFAGEVVEIGNTAIMIGMGTQDQSTNFRVKVMFTEANSDLRTGMSASVDVTTCEHNEVLAVPFAAVVIRDYDMDSLQTARQNEAVGDTGTNEVQAAENDEAEGENDEPIVKDEDLEREEIKGVFVIREGIARFIQIKTGIAGQKNIEVSIGVEENDSIISGPYSVLRTIRDGDEVKISSEGDRNREDS